MAQAAALPEPQDFPLLFSRYKWDRLHARYGWPPDCLPSGFAWIVSLESRFKAALEQGTHPDVSLVTEMVHWGGSHRNVLASFREGLSTYGNYEVLLQKVVDSLDSPQPALRAALAIPGFGLTYGSKLLRFCRPSTYGVLDGRIRNALTNTLRPIYDSNATSMCKGYDMFLALLHCYQRSLRQDSILRPSYGSRGASCDWAAAEVEMALFSWASEQ